MVVGVGGDFRQRSPPSHSWRLPEAGGGASWQPRSPFISAEAALGPSRAQGAGVDPGAD